MKKSMIILFSVLFILLFLNSVSAYEAMVGPTGILKYDKEKSYGGHTLFAPMVNCKNPHI